MILFAQNYSIFGIIFHLIWQDFTNFALSKTLKPTFTMEEPTSVNYLLVSQQDMEWGTTVSTVGHQRISPHSPYPSTNHPSLYLFSTSQGRILNEYQIIYIIGGHTICSLKPMS